MRIDQAAISMASSHELLSRQDRTERITAWTGDPPPTSTSRPEPPPKVEKAAPRLPEGTQVDLQPTAQDKLKMAIVKRLLESLTGHEVRFVVVDVPAADTAPPVDDLAAKKAAVEGSLAAPRQGWGLAVDYHEVRTEVEQTAFSAEGKVKTQDGQEIAFSVRLNMSRAFTEEQSLQLRAGDAKLKDPLVVNFEGQAAELTEQKFSFDLDSDGEPDQVSYFGQGSGFLALDRNGDGQINDGKELFGPTTGQGFGELAQLDRDGNGWIDAADPLYGQLRIWTRDGQGQPQLFALGEKGIGALYVGGIDSSFALKDSQQKTAGQVRQSGLFLKEDGQAGTIQQIDLAV